MIFSLEIQAEGIDHLDLYTCFIDPTKVFLTVNRDALGTILSVLGCPQKLINLIRLHLFHDGMSGSIPSGIRQHLL